MQASVPVRVHTSISRQQPIQADTSPAGRRAPSLANQVTAFTAACVLVSNMIGTGIFGTSGFIASDLGSPIWILGLWALGAVYALLGAFAYGELGAAMPRSGGDYVYIREAYGPFWGFLSGWTSLTIGFSAAVASAAHLFAGHASQLLPATHRPPHLLLALGMVWVLTMVHSIGVGAGGLVQRVLTVLKVASIVLLIAAGFVVGTGDWSHLARPDMQVSFDLETILVSFMFVTFSYSGWNSVSYIAGEIRNPARNLPRAMVRGTLAVGGLYLALNVVYLYALSVSGLASEPRELVGHKTAMVLFGSGAGAWFTTLITVSILGAASAMIWTGPRVYHAMAEDGAFPRWFAETSMRSGVPTRSIILQSTLISVLLVSGTFEQLVLYATFVLVFFAALGVSAVLVLRRRRPDLPRPYRAWTYPWGPALYLILSFAILWAAIDLRPTESLLGAATVVAGAPFYLLWKSREAVAPLK